MDEFKGLVEDPEGAVYHQVVLVREGGVSLCVTVHTAEDALFANTWVKSGGAKWQRLIEELRFNRNDEVSKLMLFAAEPSRWEQFEHAKVLTRNPAFQRGFSLLAQGTMRTLGF